MDDLISRQAALEAVTKYCIKNDLRELLADIECLPTAEPRKGKWIGIDDEPCEVWECDKCGHIVECDATLALPNYCENCGARMEE